MTPEVLDNCVTHVIEMHEGRDRPKNKRIYIGPGRDGSSVDKLSVDLKFDPFNTKMTIPKIWRDEGYVKTTFMLRTSRCSLEEFHEGWTMIEDAVHHAVSQEFHDEKPDRIAIILHPPVEYDTRDNLVWSGGGTAVAAEDVEQDVVREEVVTSTASGSRENRDARSAPVTRKRSV